SVVVSSPVREWRPAHPTPHRDLQVSVWDALRATHPLLHARRNTAGRSCLAASRRTDTALRSRSPLARTRAVLARALAPSPCATTCQLREQKLRQGWRRASASGIGR